MASLRRCCDAHLVPQRFDAPDVLGLARDDFRPHQPFDREAAVVRVQDVALQAALQRFGLVQQQLYLASGGQQAVDELGHGRHAAAAGVFFARFQGAGLHLDAVLGQREGDAGAPQALRVEQVREDLGDRPVRRRHRPQSRPALELLFADTGNRGEQALTPCREVASQIIRKRVHPLPPSVTLDPNCAELDCRRE